MPTSPKAFRSKESKRLQGNCVQRGYDWQWMKISKLKRQQDPVCEVCRDAVADDVDHVEPFTSINDPRRTDWRNLRSICRSCHNKKTRARQ